MKIAMIGSRHYEKPRKIRDTITNSKRKFGDELIIISGGAKDEADRYIKKYAIEFGVTYKEFNPAHTPRNLYSAMSEDYYNKPYHVSQFHHRNMLLAKDCDVMIAFAEGDVTNGTKSAIQAAKRLGKKVVIIT
jgi:hypothetical protein